MIDGPRKGIVECYFMEAEGRQETSLMVCGSDGTVKLWSIDNGTPTTLVLADCGLELTCVDRASNHQWLAQGLVNRGFQIIPIPSDNEMVTR